MAVGNAQLLQTLAESKTQKELLTLRPAKPELTAKDKEALKRELEEFRLYMNESKIDRYSNWYRAARTLAKDRARVEIDQLIATYFGGEASYQELLRTGDQHAWQQHWEVLVRRLKVAVGLSGDSELSEAIRVYGQVTLTKSSTAADVDSFLQEYMKARTEMIRQGLLSNTDHGTPGA